MKKTRKIWGLILLCIIIMTLFTGKGITGYAATTDVDTKEEFRKALNEAKDGDVVNVTADITLNVGANQTGDCFIIPGNCLVTLNLNGHKLNYTGGGSNADYIGVGNGSALIIKNGSITMMDTRNQDTGILILTNVKVGSAYYTGGTQTWIVNHSSVGELVVEDGGKINPGSQHLNPVES